MKHVTFLIPDIHGIYVETSDTLVFQEGETCEVLKVLPYERAETTYYGITVVTPHGDAFTVVEESEVRFNEN